ncbi:hypothetical protein FGO68_gene9827 [Halteria grandinella]|uniref:Uncharacterized protein n=1 Tax=Halteria grandinella TaxID=5974 RepID=A0A8J8NE66_HALGN|nr:hypothetical protein FGO68_gene9827 [Halteria grandinella]
MLIKASLVPQQQFSDQQSLSKSPATLISSTFSQLWAQSLYSLVSSLSSASKMRSALTIASTPNQRQNSPGKEVQLKQPRTCGKQLKKAFKQFLQSIREEPALSVAIMGSFSCKFVSLVISLFGSLLIQANYEAQYGPGPESEDRAKSLTSWLFLIGNVMRVPLTLYFGYLSDRSKVWVLVSLLTLICLISQGLMLVFINENSFALMIGFTGVYTFNFTIYMLSLTMLSKLVKPDSRGTAYAVFGFIGSIGVLIANKVGSILYDQYSHKWPFVMCMCTITLFGGLTVVLGVMGKLKA